MLFEFQSTTIGHSGAVESLAWDPVHRQLASTGDGLPLVWNLMPDSKLPACQPTTIHDVDFLSETLTSIILQPDKQLYVVCTVHFYDNGASLLVLFLKSSEMSVYHCVLVVTLTSLQILLFY